MLETLGIFMAIYVLRHIFGVDSEEKQAARGFAKVIEQQAHEQAKADAAAPAVTTAVVTPSGDVAHVTPTAVTPSGAATALPAAVVTPVGPASSAASPAPFPAVKPDLPPFPAGWKGGQPPGWEYAEDAHHRVDAAIQARAVALLPQLWATGEGTHTQEMTGGVWITYNAESHGKGIKGVTAYRPKAAAAA